MSSRITLKLMAELPDKVAALHFEKMVQAKIVVFGSIKWSETKRYWKNPEWFEVNFSLQPSNAPDSAYDGTSKRKSERASVGNGEGLAASRTRMARMFADMNGTMLG